MSEKKKNRIGDFPNGKDKRHENPETEITGNDDHDGNCDNDGCKIN